MLEDGRCDLCGSDIRCHCGQYTSVGKMTKVKKLKALCSAGGDLLMEAADDVRSEFQTSSNQNPDKVYREMAAKLKRAGEGEYK